MKTLKSAILVILVTCVSTAAIAGNGSGKVTQIGSVQGGIVIFSTPTHTGSPVCASIPTDWAVNTGTAEGKAIYAMLLTAVNADRAVAVNGNNACDAWGDRETATQVWLQ
ncbi:hypothetical protein [Dyella tabacisoli]|uniref:Uncharacterized protein n=1 Tax=Dyella tabacisoli TaxID=2282381 RepID=A0A369URY4_9GAMM|nr:hypothetical protein [Dyella tabacisoli]RDD83237.1 hypothetical protein DVJ77_01130 [Dyella tabacisoli]